VDSYMRAGIDAEVVKSSARKQQDELTLLRRRCDDIERVLGNTAAQAAALDRAARLARDAAGRLAAATLEERAEVIRQPDSRVVPLDDSRTPALRICGFVSDVALAHDSHSSDVHPSSIEA